MIDNIDAVEIRDNRKPGWYWVDNRLVQRDGKMLGVAAIAVYNVLASYANNDTQEAFPSIKRIAKLLGISATTVRESIEALSANGWLVVTKRKSPDGKQFLSNVYTLVTPPETAAVIAPEKRKRSKKSKGGVVPPRYQGGTATVHELDLLNKTHKNYITDGSKNKPSEGGVFNFSNGRNGKGHTRETAFPVLEESTEGTNTEATHSHHNGPKNNPPPRAARPPSLLGIVLARAFGGGGESQSERAEERARAVVHELRNAFPDITPDVLTEFYSWWAIVYPGLELKSAQKHVEYYLQFLSDHHRPVVAAPKRSKKAEKTEPKLTK